MSSPKKIVADSITKVAYAKAFTKRIKWKKVFSPKICGMLNRFAAETNTTIDIVGMMLLANTCALFRTHTQLKISETFSLTGNMFFLLIAMPEMGKTPAYKMLCRQPLESLQHTLEKSIFIDDFTKAGLMKTVAQMKGSGYICRDELCHTLVDLIKPTEGTNSFRTHLNALFSSLTYKRDLAQTSMEIKDGTLTIMGTAHPSIFAEFYQRAQDLNDGLSNRFLCFSCPVFPDETETYEDCDDVQISKDWPTEIVHAIYVDHNSDNHVEYVLSADAKEHYLSVKQASKEEQMHGYRNLVHMINTSAPSISGADIPNDSSTLKSGELALKMAMTIHVTSHKLSLLVDGKALTERAPPVIQLETYKTALAVVQQIRAQEAEYRQANEALLNKIDHTNAAEITESFLNTSRPVSMLREILLFPGQAISSTMVSRRKRQFSTELIITTMDQLSSDEGTKVFGKYVKHGNTHVYYKAPIEKISDESFAKYVSKGEYKAAYEHDMSCEPCKMNVNSWETYYKGLLDRAPKFD